MHASTVFCARPIFDTLLEGGAGASTVRAVSTRVPARSLIFGHLERASDNAHSLMPQLSESSCEGSL